VQKNTNSWHTKKGDLQCGFPLDVLMVPSLALVVAAGSERLLCDGFSLGATIRFGNLKFITDQFSGLSLSLSRDGSGTVIMNPAHRGALLLPWTLTGDKHDAARG
jgi:hypothetical protein